MEIIRVGYFVGKTRKKIARTGPKEEGRGENKIKTVFNVNERKKMYNYKNMRVFSYALRRQTSWLVIVCVYVWICVYAYEGV